MINKRLSQHHQKLIWSDNFLNSQNYVININNRTTFFKWYIKKNTPIYWTVALILTIINIFIWYFYYTNITAMMIFSLNIIFINLLIYKWYKTNFWKNAVKNNERLKFNNNQDNWYIFRKDIKWVKYRNSDSYRQNSYVRLRDYFYFKRKSYKNNKTK